MTYERVGDIDCDNSPNGAHIWLVRSDDSSPEPGQFCVCREHRWGANLPSLEDRVLERDPRTLRQKRTT